MQTAEALLEIIHERGKRGLPLERLYRHLFNPELYLRAYGKIYRNDGAMTPGVDAETVDGIRRKHHLTGRNQLRRRFCDKGWRIAHNGVVFTGASSVTVTRYRYRGANIPTPWTPTATSG